ncbi:N-acetyltransferase B complex non catalytic subunit-domain-containing protein [Peziza echinospora]|nr:N-acetyltransferase B complex non catalytic subunit-domain-containing protein [Peziza echinospora]
MLTAADMKNQHVWDALDAGTPKNALQLILRRQKKGEKSDFLSVLKAHVLTQLPGNVGVEEARGICRGLAETAVGRVEDVETLAFLGRVWGNVDGGGGGEGEGEGDGEGQERRAGMARLWEGAVKKRGADERLAKEWFLGAVRGGDWRVAQKAAMHLQKAFPKRREYYFWAVVSCILLHNSLPESAPDRKLFGMLAYRMISKAKDEVPPEADNILIPPRAIHTAQDIHLLLTIIEHASPAPTPLARSIEALAIVDSKNLGLESKIGKGDYLGLLRRKLALLKDVGRWATLWEFCGGLLRAARTPETEKKTEKKTELPEIGDDWTLWESYLTAAGELFRASPEEGADGRSVEELKRETLKTVKEYLDSSSVGGGAPATRNSELAMVKFASLFHGEKGRDVLPPPEGTPTLVEACKRYFEKVGSKTCCFEDLGRYLDVFDDAEQKDFIAFLTDMAAKDKKAEISAAGVARQINVQKFIYFLQISPLPFQIPGDGDDVSSAIKNLGISPPDGKEIGAGGATALKQSTTALKQSTTALKQSIKRTLNAFATTTLKIYVSALSPKLSVTLISTDNQYGDDAALLCVMALLRLWKLEGAGGKDTHILRAIVILETVLKKSKHNYQALLLLTRLYILVGAPYLAASSECWGRLNVKQIQHDTLSHWLLTRCSTIFPLAPKTTHTIYKAQSSGDADIVGTLNRCLSIYDSSRKQTPDMLVLALEKGSYGQVGDFVEFGRRVEDSVSKRIFEVEGRRARRIRGGSDGNGQVNGGGGNDNLFTAPFTEAMIPKEDGKPVVDNRDLAVLVNFERPGVGRFEERVLRVGGGVGAIGGKLPGGQWVRAFAFVEAAYSLLPSSEANTKPLPLTPLATSKLATYAAGIRGIIGDATTQKKKKKNGNGEESETESESEFTQEELTYLDIAAGVFEGLSSTTTTTTTTTATTTPPLITALEKQLTSLLPPSSQKQQQFTWHTLHTQSTLHESLHLLKMFLPLLSLSSSTKSSFPTTATKQFLTTTLQNIHKSSLERFKETLDMWKGVQEEVVGEVLGDGGDGDGGGFVLERGLRGRKDRGS